MKKYFLIALSVAVTFCLKGQYPTVNYAPNMCIPGSGNITYTFENFYYSHGGGFTLYRNGENIHTEGGDGVTSSSASVVALYFINESTGFLHRYGSTTYNTLLKTTDYGQTWTTFASAGPSGSFYILNENYVYVVLPFYDRTKIITRNQSDPPFPYRAIIDDSTFTTDIQIFDTVPCPTLCGGDSFKIEVVRDTNIVNYWIYFACSPGTGVNKTAINNHLITVFPNPASGSFKLDMPGGHVKAVTLYNALGQQVKQFGNEEIENNNFAIDNLANGIYYADIQLKTTSRKAKLYIQN